ncbi:hypothetical protein BC829DRAFT_444891 [Chytridium lagenaria]|nr:hypothetical protein BC829DRAFT_444891 [Chytridium lagenaria]
MASDAKVLESLVSRIADKMANSDEQFASADLVQSQLFLLRLLACCMAHYWHISSRDPSPKFPSRNGRPISTIIPKQSYNTSPHRLPSVCRPTSNFDMAPLKQRAPSTPSLPTPHPTPQHQQQTLTILYDPPALDETLAKFILTSIARFFHTSAASINAETLSHSFASEFTAFNTLGLSTPNSTIASYFLGTDYARNLFSPASSANFLVELQRAAGRVLFFLSSSNWFVVFGRVKQKLVMIGQKGAKEMEEAGVGATELTELRFLEWANLNRSRMGMVLAEVNVALRSFSKQAQFLLAIVLRRSIWNWIETHLSNMVPSSTAKNAWKTSSRRKSLFWPTQMMLLILCPDILISVSAGTKTTPIVPSNVAMKKQSWLDGVRKSLKTGKLGEVSTLCFVDLSRACSYLPKPDPIKSVIPEHDLKERLFHPVLGGAVFDEVDMDLKMTTDALTAFFRLNPWNTLRTIVAGILDVGAPMVFKVVFVRSCFEIVEEENPAPWNPTIDASLAGPLRALLAENMNRDVRLDLNRKQRRNNNTQQDDRDTTIIGLEELRMTFLSITACLQDPILDIRLLAADCLRVILSPDFISHWDGTTPDWRQQPGQHLKAPCLCFGRQRRRCWGLSRQLIEARIDGSVGGVTVAQGKEEVAGSGVSVPEKIAATVALEVALLVLLCSSDTEITTMVISCLGLLVEEVELTGEASFFDLDLYANLDGDSIEGPTSVTAILASPRLSHSPYNPPPSSALHQFRHNLRLPILHRAIVTGQKALQKRIRKVLRKSERPTAGNMGAWEEIYKRWRVLSQTVGGARGVSTDFFEDKGDWQNYTGFLCALGGVCLQASSMFGGAFFELQNPQFGGREDDFSTPDLGSPIPAQLKGAYVNAVAIVERFITELINLLVCDNVVVREAVKEFLGNELNEKLFEILLTHFENIVARFLHSSEPVGVERNVLFVESAITVLKMILERAEGSSQHDFVGISASVDFGTLGTTWRITVKMCQFVEVMVAKRDLIALRQDIRVRNTLMECLIDWNSRAQHLQMQIQMDSTDTMAQLKNGKILRDLDLGSMKAMVAVLSELPLQPASDAIAAIASAFGAPEDTDVYDAANEAKGKAVLQDVESRNMLDPQTSGRSKETLLHLNTLKEPEPPLWQVLTNLLEGGAVEQFANLGEEGLATRNRYERLLELVVQEDLSIALALSDVADFEEVANYASNIFRRNSVATRLLTVFAKAKAPIREVCANISNIVGRRFPEARVTSVGAVLFLRFICPVIVAPENMDIVPPIQSKDIRRGLVLATKVIQNLANNVLFGAKESFMAELNELLRKNIARVHAFLRNVSTPMQAPAPGEKLTVSIEAAINSVALDSDVSTTPCPNTTTCVFIDSSLSTSTRSKVSQPSPPHLANSRKHSTKSPPSSLNSRVDGRTGIKVVMSTGLNAEDFMARIQKRPGTEKALEVLRERSIFYVKGMSKERLPVIYYITRRVQPHSIDMELLLFHILTVIQSLGNIAFDVVLDASHFSANNEWDHTWFRWLEELIPHPYRRNLNAVYVYKLQHFVQRYVTAVTPSIDVVGKMRLVFASNTAELAAHIPPAELGLPDSTLAILETRQQISWKWLASPAVVTDAYRFSEVEDVLGVGDEGEFIIKYSEKSTGGGKPMGTSLKHVNVHKALNSRPGNVIQDQRILRAGDVPGTLLNMAMLNLGSGDPNLRLVSYNLLGFNWGRASGLMLEISLLSAKGLCIPANNQSFVLAVSKHLAETEENLPLTRSSSSSASNICALGFPTSPPSPETLVKGSIRAPSPAPYSRSASEHDTPVPGCSVKLEPATEARLVVEASKIWTELAKVEGMLPFILEAFFRVSVESGLGSQETEILANTLVTLASVDLSFVAGKIIHRALKGNHRVKSAPTLPLAARQEALRASLSMTSLMFDRFLPELCHLLILLVGLGRPLIRTSVHGIAVNVVHSLCTLTGADPVAVQNLKQILMELSDPKVCVLFGLSGAWSPSTSNSAFKFSSEALSGEILHEISPASLESIVNLLVQVMSTGAGDPALAIDWKSRWVSLIVEVTFHYDLAIQPRTFVALGVLSQEGSDDGTLFQTLFALYAHLNLFDDGDCNMIVSIVQCLANMAKGFGASTDKSRDSLLSLAWFSLVQIANPAVFAAAAGLVATCLQVLDSARAFEESGLAETLMRARTPLQDATNELDRSFNVWFGADFSFAFGANLLKGLRHHLTRAPTLALLTTLLEVSGRVPRDDGSGLPDDSENPFELFKLGGVPGHAIAEATASAEAFMTSYSNRMVGLFPSTAQRVGGVQKYKPVLSLFPPLSDEYRAMLMIGMTVVLLENVESDSEMRFIYGFLAECANAAPEVFSLVYDSLVPRMQTVLSQSQTSETLEAIQSIFRSVMSMTRSQQVPSSLLTRRSSVSSGTSSAGVSITTVGNFTLPNNPSQPLPTFQPTHQQPLTLFPPQAPPPSLPVDPARKRTTTPTGVMASSATGLPNPLAQNANAVAFLGELGFKGMPEMGSFSTVPKARKINNARLAAVVVRMVFDAAGLAGGDGGMSTTEFPDDGNLVGVEEGMEGM